MTIAFIHSQTSFLPELEAYHAFFRSRGVQCESFHKPQWKKNEKKFDVEWHMLGTDMLQKTCPIRIHEYASASTPPFGPIKNKLKCNVKRLNKGVCKGNFQNEEQKYAMQIEIKNKHIARKKTTMIITQLKQFPMIEM
jgi:hypothetical protein